MPKSTLSTSAANKTVYRFEVRLLSGPFALAKGQRKPLRVIDIRGSQTLESLHTAIDDAFDRDDDHLFEFQIGGKKPKDKDATLYAWPEHMNEDCRDVRTTKIASLGLEIGHFFFYLFDFGDEWMHRVRLEEIMPAEPGVKYPLLVKKQGDSPPQYAGSIGDEADDEDLSDEAPAEEVDEMDEPEAVSAADAADAADTPEVPAEAPEEDQEPDVVTDAARREARVELKALFGAVGLQPKHDLERLLDIFSRAVTVCRRRLGDDYAVVCGNLMLNMDQLGNLPLDKGGADIWAAGMVHALGYINDLEDPAVGELTMQLADIAPYFGVAASTQAAKSRVIRRGLGIGQSKPPAFLVNPPPEEDEQEDEA